MSYEYHYARERRRTVRAWLPTRLSDGTWTWLTRVTIHEVFYLGHDNNSPDFWDVRSRTRYVEAQP